jgi:hypothetical protein
MSDTTTSHTAQAGANPGCHLPHQPSFVRIFSHQWDTIAESAWDNGDPDHPDHQEIKIRVLMPHKGLGYRAALSATGPPSCTHGPRTTILIMSARLSASTPEAC